MDTTNSLSEMQKKMHALLRAGRHDEAFAYADKAEALQTQESRAFAAYARGVINSERGSYPDALAHLRQSIELFQSVGDDLGVARSSSMVGKIHTMVGDYPSALMVFRSALDYFGRVGEKHSMALTLTGIGHVLNGTGEHQKALEVFYRALALSTEAGDATSMAVRG
ncbi:MAG: tetratricopeptide repeat protein [Ignavibacteria bacterium]|nr:tetratricopeptide repeat protein [Ignavibacteria bacterium]